MSLPDNWIVLIDFDGTLSREESLARAARLLGVGNDFEKATRDAVSGADADYGANLLRRVEALSRFDIKAVAAIVESVELRQEFVDLIRRYPSRCVIVTSNLRCWCGGVGERLGCSMLCSEPSFENGMIVSATLIDKLEIVRRYQADGYRVIMIGDGANDLPAIQAADLGIKVGSCTDLC